VLGLKHAAGLSQDVRAQPTTCNTIKQAIHIINTLTKELDIHAAMESVRHVALELLECERVTLFLINELRQELRCVLDLTISSQTLWENAAVFCSVVRRHRGTACRARMPGSAAYCVSVVLCLLTCRGNTGPADEGRTITVKFGEGIAGVVAQNGTPSNSSRQPGARAFASRRIKFPPICAPPHRIIAAASFRQQLSRHLSALLLLPLCWLLQVG
jgi:hypothetical protein